MYLEGTTFKFGKFQNLEFKPLEIQTSQLFTCGHMSNDMINHMSL